MEREASSNALKVERPRRYAEELKQVAADGLNEEAVLVTVTQIYHAL